MEFEDLDTLEDGEGDAAAGGDGAAPGGDAPTADAASGASLDAGAEGADSTAASGDAAPPAVADGAAKPDPTASDLPTWDGQVASLEKQDWWGKLPEDARPAVATGLKGILTGWQRTYNGKLEELAGQRKGLEGEKAQIAADREDVAAQEQHFLRVISNEENPIKTRDDKIAELTAALEEARTGVVGKVAEDAQGAVAKAKELWDREKTELSGRVNTAETTLKQFTDEIETAYREHLSEWVANHAPDLADDGKEPALQLWLELHARGNALDDALKMVRTKFPGPDAPSIPAKVTDAIANMNMGDRTTKRQPGAGGQDVWEQIRRETTEIAQWPTR